MMFLHLHVTGKTKKAKDRIRIVCSSHVLPPVETIHALLAASISGAHFTNPGIKAWCVHGSYRLQTLRWYLEFSATQNSQENVADLAFLHTMLPL